MTEACQSEKTVVVIDATTTQESASSTCETSAGIPEAIDRVRDYYELSFAWKGIFVCVLIFAIASFYRTGEKK